MNIPLDPIEYSFWTPEPKSVVKVGAEEVGVFLPESKTWSCPLCAATARLKLQLFAALALDFLWAFVGVNPLP